MSHKTNSKLQPRQVTSNTLKYSRLTSNTISVVLRVLASLPQVTYTSHHYSLIQVDQSDFPTASVSQSSCCCGLKLPAAVSCHDRCTVLHKQSTSQPLSPVGPPTELIGRPAPHLFIRSSAESHQHHLLCLHHIRGIFLYSSWHHYPLNICFFFFNFPIVLHVDKLILLLFKQLFQNMYCVISQKAEI